MGMAPNIVHYCFGMAPDFGGKPWSLVHYACLRSAIEFIKPDEIHLYYAYEPTGPWWDITKPFVTAHKIDDPKFVFDRPLNHPAHKADIVRLDKLIEHGGIYLDADVMVRASFDDLRAFPTVLGQEKIGDAVGLANAIIVAQPGAPFLVRWKESYKSFRSLGRDKYWAEHSVALPRQLSFQHPDEIHILPPNAFFWPTWQDDGLKRLFEHGDPISAEGVYAHHLWEAQAWTYLDGLTPGRVRRETTNFNLWARPYLVDLPDDFGAVAAKSASAPQLSRMASTLKAIFKSAKTALRSLRKKPPQSRQKIFQDIYKRGLWGKTKDDLFYSGATSRGQAADDYVVHMAKLLNDHAEEIGRSLTLVDLGCGDFEIGRRLIEKVPGLKYLGCDIVPELIAHHLENNKSGSADFRLLDIVSEDIPNADVCILRHVLQNFSNGEIGAAVGKLNHKYVYVTESHPKSRIGEVNPDKATGFDIRFDQNEGRGRGVELSQPPFFMHTEEVFRDSAPQLEVITERIHRTAPQ